MATIIFREFVVDPTIIGMKAIDATKCMKYAKEQVVATMPVPLASEGVLCFLQIGLYTSAEELEAVCEKRGLQLADPHTLCAFNTANPDFVDTYPNGTQWKDAQGNFCYADFRLGDGGRCGSIGFLYNGWDGHWWLACVSAGSSL